MCGRLLRLLQITAKAKTILYNNIGTCKQYPDSTQPLPLPEVGCRVLEAPENGQVQLSGTSVGSQAFYSCNKGFLLVGDRVRVCKAEGEWSNQAPVCQGEC